MTDKVVLSDPKHFKALSHPIRQNILRVLAQGPGNLTEIGEKIGQGPASVLYHIRKLEDANLVRVKNQTQVGSITVKYYELASDTIVADTTTASPKDIQSAVSLGNTYVDETISNYKSAVKNGLATGLTVEEDILLDKNRWMDFYNDLQNLFKKYKKKPTGKEEAFKKFTSTIIMIENQSNKRGE